MMDWPLNEWMKPKRGIPLEGQKLREESSERGQVKIEEESQKSSVKGEDLASGKRWRTTEYDA